ncbi:MAG: DUF4136 domain-containing protein [Saprospiraceae bacterium]|nr:DUF4136 domain-containing protein [Saprospiraceae bacterium]
MKRILPFFLLAMVLWLAQGCAPATQIYSEPEPGVNLYKYSTFKWLDNPTIARGNSGPEWLNKATEDDIRGAVEQQLRRYGINLCEDNPDLMLHYHVVIKNEVFYIRDWWCDEESWRKYGHCNRVKPVQYREGTLIIDMIDAKTGDQVWRGVATGALENMTPEEAEVRIYRAVRMIFEKFPQTTIPGA